MNGTTAGRHPALVPVGVAVLAAAWSLAVLGMPGLVPLVVVGLTGLAVTVAVMWRWPAFSAAMLPVAFVAPKLGKVFSYEVLLVGIFIGMLVVGWQRRSAWLGRLSTVELVVIAFLVWGLLSVFWVREFWWWVFGVRKYLFGILALWVAWRLARFVDHEVLLAGIPLGACAVSLAVVAKASQAGFFGSVNAENMRTTATDLGWGFANYLAAIVAVMLPTGIYLALNGTRRWVRAVGWASIPAAAVLVTIAASRGGAVMLLAIALFAIFRSKVKPWLAVSASLMLLLFMLVGPGGQFLLARFSRVEDAYSVVSRFIFFRDAWQRAVDHWPLGMGLAQSFSYSDRLGINDPHNYWLSLASEFGLVGLLLWTAQTIIVWRRIVPLVRDPATEHAGRALQLTFAVAQLNLLFEPTFTGIQYQFIYYWVLGVYFGVFEDRRSAVAAVRTA